MTSINDIQNDVLWLIFRQAIIDQEKDSYFYQKMDAKLYFECLPAFPRESRVVRTAGLLSSVNSMWRRLILSKLVLQRNPCSQSRHSYDCHCEVCYGWLFIKGSFT